MSFHNMNGSLTELARSVSYESQIEESPSVDPNNFALAFAAVIVCGAVNNFSYCIISGASQSLARQWGAESQVTLLTMTMSLSCFASTLISTKLLLRFRFYCRVRLVLVMNALAYLGVAGASTLSGLRGFAVALASAVAAGLAQVVGETTNLAFLKAFPAELIGGWGAGTGIAGIGGSGVFILLSGPLALSNSVIFALVLPTVLVYWLAFHYLHKEATRGLQGTSLRKVLGGTAEASPSGSRSASLACEDASGRGPLSAPASWANIQLAVRSSGSIMANMVIVYFLEYLIYPGLDDRETLCSSHEWYTIMWMSYNVGVTLSRLSVAMFRIERIWLLTCLQLVNLIGWVVEVWTGGIRGLLPQEGGLYLMTAWMAVVGLCGGATYGNCMYLFNRKEGIPDHVRELGINLGFVMSNLGITVATLSFSLLNQNILAKSVLYPSGC